MAVKMPSARDLERLRLDRFGEGKPGSVQVAVAEAGDRVDVVYADGAGAEVGREPWDPDRGEQPPAGPLATASVRGPGPVPETLAPAAEATAEAEPRGRRR